MRAFKALSMPPTRKAWRCNNVNIDTYNGTEKHEDCSGPWVGLAGYGPWGENHVYCVRLCLKLYPLFLSREILLSIFLCNCSLNILQLDHRCETNLEPAHTVSMPHSSSLAGSSSYNHIITNPPL
jgi:hypothetical protein